VVGRAKKLQFCVALKASIARNESTVGPGNPTIVPIELCAAISSAVQSRIPGTSNALVLLSTILFLNAFLSPGAGALFGASPFLLFESRSVFFPFCAPAAPEPFFAVAGRDDVVENEEVKLERLLGRGNLLLCDGSVERQRHNLCDDIVYLNSAMIRRSSAGNSA